MELVWVLLTPFLWIWWLLWFVISRPWMVAVLIAATSIAYLLIRQRRNRAQTSRKKTSPTVVTQHSVVISTVLQVLPVHPRNGWVLADMGQGLRVFTRFFPSLSSTALPCVAASIILDVPPKKALSLAVNSKELVNWLEGVSSLPQYLKQPRGSHDHDGDIIKVMIEEPKWRLSFSKWVLFTAKKKMVRFAEKYATFLDGYLQPPVAVDLRTETLERTWYLEDGGLGYIFTVPREPSSLPFCWSLLIFSAPKDKGLSIATLVMLPNKGQNDISSILTSQLCSLREHILFRKCKAYVNPQQDCELPNSWTVSHGGSSSTRQTTADGVSSTTRGESLSTRRSGESSSTNRAHGGARRSSRESSRTLDNGRTAATRPPLKQDQESPKQGSDRQGSETRLIQGIHSPTSPSMDAISTQPPSSIPNHVPRPNTSDDPIAALDAKYISIAKDTCQELIDNALATEQDGWVTVGTTKDIFIMKKPPQKGEDPPLNAVKGTGYVNAPPEFINRVIPTNQKQLDDMLREVRLIHETNITLNLAHLMYKAVWPSSPRDFAMLSVGGQIDEHTWVQAGVSVEDYRIPEEKGYVRANLISGGYMIRDCPGQPERSQVTYVAKLDLKGTLPAFVVNKVSDSQPQCINRLRAFVEPLYAEMKNNPQRMTEFENSHPIGHVLQEAKSPTLNPEDRNPEDRNPEDRNPEDRNPAAETATENEHVPEEVTKKVDSDLYQNGLPNGTPELPEDSDFIMVEDDDATSDGGDITIPPLGGGSQPNPDGDVIYHSLSSPSSSSLENGMIVMETLETYTPEEMSSEEDGGKEGEVEGEAFLEKESLPFQLKNLPVYRKGSSEREEKLETRHQSLTKETIAYPRHGTGGVDFRTMGNQTAAKVLEEMFYVSNLDLSDPLTFKNQSNGWQFLEVDKEVLILRKKWPNSPFYSFMGKGIIDLPPQEVYDSIRNPQLRFTYDNMLKELHIVKRIEDGLYILHLHHETTQCFIRQARDFCVLVNERSEPNKKLLIGTSIDVAECPTNPNITRGKIHCSGWVVEPRRIKGKLCTEITYLLQVDVGGLPPTMVNFVSKRQPLAIAYLRDYLISTSLHISSKHT